MTDTQKSALQQLIEQWQLAAPVLQQVRDEDIRHADTKEAMRIFTGSANWAAKHRPPAAASGLVEQQRWFMRLKTTSTLAAMKNKISATLIHDSAAIQTAPN